MAGKKEIRNKIASTRNTQKITRAMEMVSISKMRRTQDQAKAARPYTHALVRMIEHLTHANPEYKHPYLFVRNETKNVAVIVVSSDRGQCGGLNANLFRLGLRSARNWQKEGKQVRWSVIGRKASVYFSSIKAKVDAQLTNVGDKPKLESLFGIVHSQLELFQRGEVDEIWLASNNFVNTLTQKPSIERLVPISPECLRDFGGGTIRDGKNSDGKMPWDYIYEPDAKEILDSLLLRFVETLVYHGVVENIACEQAARMMAMRSATDNAGTIIKELQLMYNKARQAAITQEIAELVAGAAAV